MQLDPTAHLGLRTREMVTVLAVTSTDVPAMYEVTLRWCAETYSVIDFDGNLVTSGQTELATGTETIRLQVSGREMLGLLAVKSFRKAGVWTDQRSLDGDRLQVQLSWPDMPFVADPDTGCFNVSCINWDIPAPETL